MKYTDPPQWPIPLIMLLTIITVSLKLTGVLNWSWIWILSPVWIPIIGTVSLLIVSCTIAAYSLFVKALFKEIKDQVKSKKVAKEVIKEETIKKVETPTFIETNNYQKPKRLILQKKKNNKY